MERKGYLELSRVEARELKDLVEAEMDRRFVAIKEKLEHYWTVVVGYDAEEAWSELRALIDELVKSNLASLDKSLALVLAVPPVKAPPVEVPPEPEPVPIQGELPVEPGEEVPAEVPEPEPGTEVPGEEVPPKKVKGK
ncbi:hypothetical protein ES708_22592 [subsurface metagenome]